LIIKTSLAAKLKAIIRNDPWMMDKLQLVDGLKLPDCWIGAGFIRSKVWDYFHQFEARTPLDDLDVVFFDSTNTVKTIEKKLEEQLKKADPSVNWSVKNQARMHLKHGHEPYKNTEEAVSCWTETATAVAVRLASGKIEIIAPWGLEDLLELKVRPTLQTKAERPDIYRKRVKKKNWKGKWPLLDIEWI